MISYARGILRVAAVTMITAGLLLGMTARAAPIPDTELKVAKADVREKLAAEYRARSHEGRKDAIVWFTLANRLDQEAQHDRQAAR